MTFDNELLALSGQVGEAALARRAMIATAESCTGGLVAAALTAVPGSSAWFDRGFVTYSNDAKSAMLSVPLEILERHGAVSEQTAAFMARGALSASSAQRSVAITGIAGPGGGSAEKPVGTVCFAWASSDKVTSLRLQLPGDRTAIRDASVRVALEGLLSRLMES
jgi:nicotinamide-nucleotide amidase